MADATYKLGNFVAGFFNAPKIDPSGYTLHTDGDIGEWRSVTDRLHIKQIVNSAVEIPKIKVHEGVIHKLRPLKEGGPDRIVIEGALREPITFNALGFGDKIPIYKLTFKAGWKVLIENNVLNIPLYYPYHDGGWPKLQPDLIQLAGGKRTSRKRSYRRKTRTRKSRR
jgi:hypothetical protein